LIIIAMINIVENTLRDGSYVVDFQFTSKNTYDVTKGLDALGFGMIEIGHGLGLGAWNNSAAGLSKENDVDYIKAARDAASRSKIGVFFIPGIGTKADMTQAAETGIDFIRIGTNIDNFKGTLEYLEHARDLGLFTCVNLMKSYAVKSYEFTKIVQEIDRWQMADVIYLVDSAGCMMPEEVFTYIDRTKENITTPLGFHGHNNLSLAVANTLQAMRAGATYLDTCVRAMGRSAGNAQTEVIVFLLQQMGVIEKDIDLYDLYEFANDCVVPLMPRPQGLTDEEVHIGVSKFHTSFMPFANRAASKYGVDKRKLIQKVSAVNCLNPTEDLFHAIAKTLSHE
jgi:4-hydroxy 2-oxovalerate aldolase